MGRYFGYNWVRIFKKTGCGIDYIMISKTCFNLNVEEKVVYSELSGYRMEFLEFGVQGKIWSVSSKVKEQRTSNKINEQGYISNKVIGNWY